MDAMADSASRSLADCFKRGWPRWPAVAVLAALVAASCGGGAGETDQGPTSSGEADSEPADQEIANDRIAFLSRVELPPSLVVSDADNQTASVNGVAYIVTETVNGMQLVRVDRDGASFTDAVITGATRAEVWDSGTRVVMTGVSDGDMVILSSSGGEAFTEALIPIPQRYVDADVWQASSLMGDALGVADLAGDLLVVAALGVRWPADFEVVATHAYTVSQEAGDAAQFADTVTQTSRADGDTLYTFEVDGEVVFEVLGSEAGIEPGYLEAFRQSFESDTMAFGSWIVSGSDALQTSTAPFGGGLDDNLRLEALYPVEGGAAAIVIDLLPDDSDADEEGAVGALVLVSAAASQVVPAQSGDYALRKAFVYLFGPAPYDEANFGRSATVPGEVPDQAAVAANVEKGSYTMAIVADGEMTVYDSDDGADWETVETVTRVPMPDGSQVTVESSGDSNFILVWPGSEGEGPQIFNADGFVDDNGFLLAIDIETGDPKAWKDEFPSSSEIPPVRQSSDWEPSLLEWLFSLGDPEDQNGDPLFLDVYRANVTDGMEAFLGSLDAD